jgi:recombination protein RecA
MKGAVADAEGTLDIDWAERIGADPEKYLVVYGDHGQQVADIADSVLQADDCGLLVVDSLANLVPSAEMEESADAEFYAIQARLIGRMVRKLKQRLIRERKREHPCAIIFVNQMRMDLKAGKYQNPEKMSGGHALKHEFSLLFRSRAKALTEADKKYLDKTRAKSAIKRFAFSVRKSKVFTLSGLGEYLRVEEDIPDEDLSAGQINDYTTTINYAKEYGIIRKEKSKWRYFDFESIRTLSDIKNMLIKKPDEFLHLKIQIVKRAVARIKG